MLTDAEASVMSKASAAEAVIAELENEITRLRAEVARLEAGRLRPETVRALRKTLLNCGDWNAGAESLADLGRCYPPEEV